jgi:hypothetical protein
MAGQSFSDRVGDPADLLGQAFEHVWDEVCTSYDVRAEMPDLSALLDGADLICPGDTARAVVANMLLEVMGCVSRFSPWYRQPARAYGLIRVQEGQPRRTRWGLAPEAVQKWQGCLDVLSVIIRKNSGLIQAVLLVDGLMSATTEEDLEIIVSCHCLPPRRIQVRRSVLDQADIMCDACLHPFS